MPFWAAAGLGIRHSSGHSYTLQHPHDSGTGTIGFAALELLTGALVHFLIGISKLIWRAYIQLTPGTHTNLLNTHVLPQKTISLQPCTCFNHADVQEASTRQHLVNRGHHSLIKPPLCTLQASSDVTRVLTG